MTDDQRYLPDATNPLGDVDDIDDILTLIKTVPDVRVSRDLDFFVRNYDFRATQSFRELAEGYRGVFLLSLHLGPKGGAWRKTIELCLKCMDGFGRAMKDYMEIEFPDDIRKELDVHKKKMVEATKELMTPEHYREFCARMGYDDAKD